MIAVSDEDRLELGLQWSPALTARLGWWRQRTLAVHAPAENLPPSLWIRGHRHWLQDRVVWHEGYRYHAYRAFA